MLLHPLYGLCVCIFEDQLREQRYIVLRPDNVNLSNFVEAIFGSESKIENISLEKSKLRSLFNMMDTEWDEKIMRYMNH